MDIKVPKCPRCKIGHLRFDKVQKIMICDYCGLKKTTGKDKSIEKDNLQMGKKFNISFL